MIKIKKRPRKPEELMRTKFLKYPKFYVKGKSVTRKQALDIVLRTNDYWYASGSFDRDYFGISEPELYKYGIFSACNAEHQCIASPYVGSKPYGWCSLDGTIAGDMYGHRSWDFIELYLPWRNVARRFPFLELDVLVMNFENGWGNDETQDNFAGEVLMTVKNGKVKLSDPSGIEWKSYIPKPYSIPAEFSDSNNPHQLSRALVKEWLADNCRDVDFSENPADLIRVYVQELFNDVFFNFERIDVPEPLLDWKEREICFCFPKAIPYSFDLQEDIKVYVESLGLSEFTLVFNQ